MLAHSLFFYFFSTIAVFAAIMVTVSRNTVYSVFFLILVFITISILFIMIGAEFLGMIMLIVYVGAVAVLFLFVVMMLNITEQITKRSKRKGLINNISVGSIVGVIIFLELLVVIGGWKYKETFTPLSSINLICLSEPVFIKNGMSEFIVESFAKVNESPMNKFSAFTLP